jgi:hypothetical protein
VAGQAKFLQRKDLCKMKMSRQEAGVKQKVLREMLQNARFAMGRS